MKISTYVFMDLETTGLPSYQAYKTKITEISLVAVSATHLKSSDIPRVLNKLNLCFYPRKFIDPTSTHLSGLDNELLEYIKPFSINTYELLIKYFEQLQSPVCLVAHNGYRFDFPILNFELKCIDKSFADDIQCCDSLPAFQHIFSLPLYTIEDIFSDDDDYAEFPEELDDDLDGVLLETSIRLENDIKIKRVKNVAKKSWRHIQAVNETTPPKSQPITDVTHMGARPKAKRRLNFDESKKPKSMKLGDVYSFLIKRDLIDAHQAEVDTYALMRCCGALKSHFIEYAESNFRALNTCNFK